MKILGIETTSKISSVALLDGKRTVENFSRKTALRSEDLLRLIDAVLREGKTDLKEIDGIAVSIGPGSFTGTRVGVSSSRALAQFLKKPLAGIVSLDCLARGASGWHRVKGPFYICPVIDALRGEVFTSVYRKTDTGFKRVTDYKLVKINEILESGLFSDGLGLSRTCKVRGFPVVFTGDGVLIYRDMIYRKFKNRAVFFPPARLYPRGSDVAALGRGAITGKKGVKYNGVLPLYIRKPPCAAK